MLRTLVVDESWVSQAALRAAFRERGHEVGATDFHSVEVPADLDLAMVNLADPSADPDVDDFPGFTAVTAIRAAAPSARIVTYTSLADHHGARYRCICAGVDSLFSRTELEDGSIDEFHERVDAPGDIGRARLVLDDELKAALVERGLADGCAVEDLVVELRELLDEQEALQGLKRATRLRQEFGDRHGLTQVLRTRSGSTGAVRWDQLRAIWNFLTQT